MQTPPKVGTTHEIEFEVDTSHTVDLAKGKMPLILSTPSLIWFLEQTALELTAPYLEDGEITVGVQVEVEHLAATPLGQKVRCLARVVHSDGPMISFQVEAHDPHEPIARGIHKRRVVKMDRLAACVNQKADA